MNIIFNNGSYAILEGELANVDAKNPGRGVRYDGVRSSGDRMGIVS